MFGLTRKSNGHNGVVRWEWIRGRPVTGHLNHNGRFVDIRKAQTNVYIAEGGDLFIEFIPAKGVQTPKVVFPAEVVETMSNRYGNTLVLRITFTFFDRDIELMLPRRHRVQLD